MSARHFLDTNIVVYAYDSYQPQKQEKAQLFITEGIERENVVLSVQVLSEFFNVVTRHIKHPMSSDDAQEIISALSILPVQEIDLPMVGRALYSHREYKISYWDALIVSAAERAKCTKIITEDLNDGQTYHNIVVFNPFK